MTEKTASVYPKWQRIGDWVALWAFSMLLTISISLVSRFRGAPKQPPAAI